MADHYQTRRTLIQKIRDDRNEQAWEEFFNFYRRFIYVIIRDMNISHHDTDDLSQEVLLKVQKGIRTFEYNPGHHHFRNWLARIAKNTVLNYIAKKKRLSETMIGDDKTKVNRYIAKISVPEVDVIADKEWQSYLYNYAMEKVKERFKENVIETFQLYMKGCSTDQVVEKIGLPKNTVLVYKNRVQAALRKEIAKVEYENS